MVLNMRFFFDFRIFNLLVLYSLLFEFELLCSRFLNCFNIYNDHIMTAFFLKDNLLFRLNFILHIHFIMLNFLNFLMVLFLLFLLFCLNMLLCLL